MISTIDFPFIPKPLYIIATTEYNLDYLNTLGEIK